MIAFFANLLSFPKNSSRFWAFDYRLAFIENMPVLPFAKNVQNSQQD